MAGIASKIRCSASAGVIMGVALYPRDGRDGNCQIIPDW